MILVCFLKLFVLLHHCDVTVLMPVNTACETNILDRFHVNQSECQYETYMSTYTKHLTFAPLTISL